MKLQAHKRYKLLLNILHERDIIYTHLQSLAGYEFAR
jgi:hypothetical protein